MRALSILFLCALSTAACESRASVRAGVSVESDVAVRLGPANPDASPPAEPASRSLPPPAPALDEPCSENYDPCVPIDSDVDCAGGTGNGPSYVAGPVEVIGRDVYGLDRNNDGIGCE